METRRRRPSTSTWTACSSTSRPDWRASPAETRHEFADNETNPRHLALIDPIPGAIDAYPELADRFDTYILSTAPWKNPSAWSDKLG